MENQLTVNPNWFMNKWIISIFSSNGDKNFSPFIDRYNILKLQFDDITELDNNGIHFSVELAQKLISFIQEIQFENKPIYIHCDAGISRSGAVGYMLNEWFNKYVRQNDFDNILFQHYNPHIMPNPEVIRILKNNMFNINYENIFNNN